MVVAVMVMMVVAVMVMMMVVAVVATAAMPATAMMPAAAVMATAVMAVAARLGARQCQPGAKPGSGIYLVHLIVIDIHAQADREGERRYSVFNSK